MASQLLKNESIRRTDKTTKSPYDVVKGTVTEISFSDFKKRFPLAADYLSRNKNTIKQNVETWEDAKRWHLYTRVQNHGATYPKLLVPMTALDTFASLTLSDKTYCDNANVFFIDSPEKDETTLYALSAIINSTIYSVLARSIANPQTNGYFKFNKQFLEPVPFPFQNFTDNAKLKAQLAGVAKRIDELQNRYKTSSPSQKRTITGLLLTQWNLLDELCYQFYNLTDAQKVFFRNRGRNVNRIEILN